MLAWALPRPLTCRFALQESCSLFAKLPLNLEVAKSFRAVPGDFPSSNCFRRHSASLGFALAGCQASSYFPCWVKDLGHSVLAGLCLVWEDPSFLSNKSIWHFYDCKGMGLPPLCHPYWPMGERKEFFKRYLYPWL